MSYSVSYIAIRSTGSVRSQLNCIKLSSYDFVGIFIYKFKSWSRLGWFDHELINTVQNDSLGGISSGTTQYFY